MTRMHMDVKGIKVYIKEIELPENSIILYLQTIHRTSDGSKIQIDEIELFNELYTKYEANFRYDKKSGKLQIYKDDKVEESELFTRVYYLIPFNCNIEKECHVEYFNIPCDMEKSNKEYTTEDIIKGIRIGDIATKYKMIENSAENSEILKKELSENIDKDISIIIEGEEIKGILKNFNPDTKEVSIETEECYVKTKIY